jgi:hypothetical protein
MPINEAGQLIETSTAIEGVVILAMMRFIVHWWATCWKDLRVIGRAMKARNGFGARSAKARKSLVMVNLVAVLPALACWQLQWSPLNGMAAGYIISGLAMSATISGAHSVGKWAGVVTETGD